MAILPIDLQTLYAQLDKVGKAQVHQQVAAQAARDAEKITNRKEAELKATTVQNADAGEEKTGIVQEHQGDASSNSGYSANPQQQKKEKDTSTEEVISHTEVIHDPALGNHIDISG